MSNKQTYIKTILLSQRLKYMVSQLKCQQQEEEATSPTETVVAFGQEEKDKPLPSPPSLYMMSFDSAIDIGPVRNKPLPAITHSIIHVKRKYNGVKGLLTRSFQIHDILVSRNYSLATSCFVKLFVCKDKNTGQIKQVLKVSMTSHHRHDLYVIPQCTFTFHHAHTMLSKAQKARDSLLLCEVTDREIQSALFTWLTYQQLPSTDLVTHVLREGLKIYVVYNK
ncbi:hypothetical protein INT47_003616 [Mucor saturninus]|uniref:Uncharacterized protein n=1 Tax=Mucor saturninus TaxID=64648 RepID=A0A8H7USS0_9FUNG|nr:hypothetical protein INT47_003616 [Mucor saturninus]